ncbi:MAG TPA: extracellular solute-binding protein, partial [Thermomicrobiales bacterium]|nr:extracellular solute-binding protein [Thermomicrobiales bacterium]
AAGGEGTPDIFWPEIDMVQELGKTGILLDTTDLVTELKADLAPGKTNETFIPSTGKYAAFPGDVATVGLYYRQDLLDAAGVTVPETWDDFIVAAQTVKEKTGASSLVIPSDGTVVSTLLWQFILNQMGGAITNADGTEITLDDEKGVAAMELTRKLYQANVHIDEDPTLENYFAEVAAGHVAMAPMPVWYRGFGIEPYVTDETSGMGQWRVALLPSAGEGTARTANWGGAAIASTTYTKYPDEVRNFMKLALGTMDGAAACGDWGILPPYLPYLNSDEWKAVRSPVFGDFSFNDIWTQAVAEYPATWYKQPVFSEALTTVGAGIIAMLSGSDDIAPALKAIGDQVRELNTRYQ